jgi:hypothetical protein
MPEVLQFVNCALQRITIPGQGGNSDAPCTIFCGSHPTFHILCSGSLIQLLKTKFILFYLIIWEPSYYNVQLLYFDGTPPAPSPDNHPNLLLLPHT